MLVDRAQDPHAAIGYVRTISAGDTVVLLRDPRRVRCQVPQRRVPPVQQNPLDTVTVAADRLFTATLPDQMRIQVALPGLPQGDISWHRLTRGAFGRVGLFYPLRMTTLTDLGQVLLRDGARGPCGHLPCVADRHPD